MKMEQQSAAETSSILTSGEQMASQASAGSLAESPDKGISEFSGSAAGMAIPVEMRHTMISECAYYRYQSRLDGGNDPDADWAWAEMEVDRMLLSGTGPESSGDIAQRSTFYERVEDQLHHWDRSLADLRAKAAKKGSAVRGEVGKTVGKQLQSQLGTLEKMREEFQTRLDGLRSHTGAAWHEMKSGVESAWDEMRHAIERVTDKFSAGK